MRIQEVTDISFRKYGRVIRDFDYSELLKEMKNTPMPEDVILLVGRPQDIAEDFTYDTSKIEAFYVSAGTAVELYATTLHYVPCGVGENIKCQKNQEEKEDE